MECKTWNAERGKRYVEHGTLSGTLSVERGTLSVDRGTWNAKRGTRNVEH